MKKSLASILYVTYLAFGIPAHAAEETYSPPVATHVASQDTAKSQKKAQHAADRALAKKVRSALTKTKGLQTINITVLARHGVISLTGNVPDNEQVQLAGDTATKIAGVTSVTNNLVTGEAGN
ncbi:osmotically-inducible protein OsmY [Paraburkholderia bannensis]|uniref:Osmotically-inducible protein OsmY n=1 Tax=Paraburkholderia bannensis TaxID=765414 RepID=A0A7W9U199_9BURK|nr:MULTISPECIES: BON domain-containing protein [Paraburkholderia]MBB3262148.1 osmotically-inducible protein OsmY [Paraburkholderia sp. WP4_3_2]MBB6105143.1 osmotically-inducible protein OsmY [Paraburkholderia bannensis]